jgi:hypothetical protein
MTIAQLQVRRGTAAQWTAANPILAAGEFGLETDTGRIKIGDGSTAWNSLTRNLIISDISQSMSNKSMDVTPDFDDNDTGVTALPDATVTTISLLTEVNTAGSTWFETVSDNIITVKKAGFYNVNAFAAGTGTAMASNYFAITKNGTAIHVARHMGWGGSAAATAFVGTPTGLSIPLAANDTLRLVGFQDGTGAGTTVHDANNVSRLVVVYAGS